VVVGLLLLMMMMLSEVSPPSRLLFSSFFIAPGTVAFLSFPSFLSLSLSLLFSVFTFTVVAGAVGRPRRQQLASVGAWTKATSSAPAFVRDVTWLADGPLLLDVWVEVTRTSSLCDGSAQAQREQGFPHSAEEVTLPRRVQHLVTKGGRSNIAADTTAQLDEINIIHDMFERQTPLTRIAPWIGIGVVSMSKRKRERQDNGRQRPSPLNRGGPQQCIVQIC
jgi:hypothetical protein